NQPARGSWSAGLESAGAKTDIEQAPPRTASARPGYELKDKVLTLVGDAATVLIEARATGDVTIIGDAVLVAVGLTLVRPKVPVAILARPAQHVAVIRPTRTVAIAIALVGYTVLVAVVEHPRREVAVVGNAISVTVRFALVRD